MKIMVFCKLRLADLAVLLTGSVVPDLHFIGSSSPRVFIKNSFPQLSTVHELGEFQR
jgi:predicted component of type VI protein secretion system